MRRGARHLHPYVERLIGTLRRECLDHVIIFSDRHLHRVMREYLATSESLLFGLFILISDPKI